MLISPNKFWLDRWLLISSSGKSPQSSVLTIKFSILMLSSQIRVHEINAVGLVQRSLSQFKDRKINFSSMTAWFYFKNNSINIKFSQGNKILTIHFEINYDSFSWTTEWLFHLKGWSESFILSSTSHMINSNSSSYNQTPFIPLIPH